MFKSESSRVGLASIVWLGLGSHLLADMHDRLGIFIIASPKQVLAKRISYGASFALVNFELFEWR